jgi:glycolate oxidase iron-sulfur subunit
MQDMKRLAGLVKTLEDQLVVCMRCGMCQAVCPLFAETGRESDVARGKLALLDGLLHEMFDDPAGVSDRLARCLLCGSCAANCPSGVKVLDIFLKARAILTGYMGLPPLKQALFRGMLSHPVFFDRLMEWGSKVQVLFAKPVDDLLGTSCARFMSHLADRHFKSLAPVPFHRMAEAVEAGRPVKAGGLSGSGKTPASGLRVGFLVGCLIDKVFPHVAQAVVRSLHHHGVEVVIPRDQGCCGIPALSAGDTDTFHKLVRHNLKRFDVESLDYIVTACATCASTIGKVWPMMSQGMKDHEKAQVSSFSGKVLDITQLLVDKLSVSGDAPQTIDQLVNLTYHDPCHLKKSLGVAAQPRAVLRSNPRYRLQEMAEADRCCGCGGSFNLQHYGVSASIGQRKRDNIARSGCKVVATGCPACMLHISDMLSQNRDGVEVKHTIEIYAESLDR